MTTQYPKRGILATLALAGAVMFLVLLESSIAQAITLYRLPLAYIPWPITAWVDHWRTPYAPNVNVRYDATVIPQGSPFYYNYLIFGRHQGTDFGVPAGNPVYAAASGTVAYVYPTPGSALCQPADLGPCAGFGNWVAILHPDGVYSIYAHLSSVNVYVGQSITCVSGPGGALIGYSGNTGGDAGTTGADLHFELRRSLSKSSTTGVPSIDPFGGTYSQPFDYWYQYAWVSDLLRPGFQMHYPTTTCSP